jgi:hypothetical protein
MLAFLKTPAKWQKAGMDYCRIARDPGGIGRRGMADRFRYVDCGADQHQEPLKGGFLAESVVPDVGKQEVKRSLPVCQ